MLPAPKVGAADQLVGGRPSAGVDDAFSKHGEKRVGVELADLRLPGRERLLEQVMGNLSVLVAHRQVLPESCALVAGLAGTRGAWRTSRHSDGRTTRTRTTEGVLNADALMRLGAGHAALIVLTRAAGARVVRIFSGAAR